MRRTVGFMSRGAFSVRYTWSGVLLYPRPARTAAVRDEMLWAVALGNLAEDRVPDGGRGRWDNAAACLRLPRAVAQ
jgi:hypothetical protein